MAATAEQRSEDTATARAGDRRKGGANAPAKGGGRAQMGKGAGGIDAKAQGRGRRRAVQTTNEPAGATAEATSGTATSRACGSTREGRALALAWHSALQ